MTACDILHNPVIASLLAVLITFSDPFAVTQEVELSRNVTTKIIVLSDEPINLDMSGRTLEFPGERQLVGKTNVLCVVLSETSDFSDTINRQRQYQRILSGTTLIGVIVVNDNNEVQLSPSSYAWHREGYILEANELSSCMAVPSDDQYEVGDTVSSAVISSSKNIKVLGIYWRSTNKYDDKR